MQINLQGGVSSKAQVGPLEDSNFLWLHLWQVHLLCRSERSRDVLVPNVSVSRLYLLILLCIADFVVKLVGIGLCAEFNLGIGGVFRLCCVWCQVDSVLVPLLDLLVNV